jgi:hypothetical protein
MGQPHTGQEIKGDLSSQKMEASQRANLLWRRFANAQQENHQLNSSNQQPISTTTQTTERNDVPTTTQNLYEKEVGWNMTQSNTVQEIEGSFSAQKLEDAIATTPNVAEPLASTNTQTTKSNDVPTITEKLYENGGGWNIAQSNTGQEIEGSFSAQKLEEEIAAEFPNVNESSSSINTQTTERDDVPTPAEKLYEIEGGWNITQPNTEQEIEVDLSSQKMETNLAALAQLRTSQLDSSDEQPISTTTQTTERNDVPTTTQNLYEKEVGWNTNGT